MSDSQNLSHNQVATDDLCEVIITAPDADWLAEFIQTLIADRICAGSHLTQIRSLYPWRGKVYDRPEARAAFRTRTARLPEIINRARATHPYEVPSVIAVPIIAANPDYADWVRENTQDVS